MSSVAAPFGLNPIGRFDTGSLEVFRQYPIKSGESTAIVKGDVVQLVNASNATTIAKMTGTMDGSATDIMWYFHGLPIYRSKYKSVDF